LTGGIREGAKGEPPVAIFYSATARYSPTAPNACLVEPDCSRFRFAPLHQCVEVKIHRYYYSKSRPSNFSSLIHAGLFPIFFFHPPKNAKSQIPSSKELQITKLQGATAGQPSFFEA
jgi:hypothetical protein